LPVWPWLSTSSSSRWTSCLPPCPSRVPSCSWGRQLVATGSDQWKLTGRRGLSPLAPRLPPEAFLAGPAVPGVDHRRLTRVLQRRSTRPQLVWKLESHRWRLRACLDRLRLGHLASRGCTQFGDLPHLRGQAGIEGAGGLVVSVHRRVQLAPQLRERVHED